jgi:hypothetical protein
VLDGRVAQVPELVEVVAGVCVGTVAFGDDGAQFAGDHEQARHREPVPGQGAVPVFQGALKFALPGGKHAEGNPRFGVPHGREFGSGGIGPDPDDFGGVGLGELVLGAARVVAGAQDPVAVHRVEVPFRGVDGEVVIEVLRVRHVLQQRPALVERDFDLAPVPDPGPRFGFLGMQLDGCCAVRGDVVWPVAAAARTPR